MKEYFMKQYFIQFDMAWAFIALCIVALAVIISMMVGYILGIRTAERKFCNDYLTDALTPPSTPQ